MRSTSIAIHLTTLLLLTAAGVVSASDGVLEINQTCAAQTGCFAGDTAGFPVTITRSVVGHSFRLTSDLIVPNVNLDGITVDKEYVSIDLNGFGILGIACALVAGDCTPVSGTGHGIRRDPVLVAGAAAGLSVRNGTVAGMGQDGLHLGDQAIVSDVRARWNGGHGIFAQLGSTVTNSSAEANGENGIHVTAVNSVVGSTSRNNQGHGFWVGAGSVVSNCAASSNGENGIQASHDGVQVSDSSARNNTGLGISLGEASGVTRSTVTDNGPLWGMILGAGSGFSGNTIRDAGGAFSGVNGGVDAGGNVCNGVLGGC